MKRFIITTLVMGIALLGLQAQAQANLLSDPGFDSMAVQELGWSTTPWWGKPPQAAVTDAEAQSSSHSAELRLLGSTDWSMVAQSITSGISPGTTYVASASFLRRASIDPAWVFFKIEWPGSGSSPDESPVMFNNSDSADVWVEKSYDQFTAPATATAANYIIIYETADGADPADIWIDDTYFDAIPEPATMLLFGSGLVGLFGFSRRKRS